MQAKTSPHIDPWAAMDALVKTTAEPVGNGWFTLNDFMQRYDLSDYGARARLRKLEKAGKVESWKGTAAANRRVVLKFRVI